MAGDDVNGCNDDNGGGYEEEPHGGFGGSHCSLVFVVDDSGSVNIAVNAASM